MKIRGVTATAIWMAMLSMPVLADSLSQAVNTALGSNPEVLMRVSAADARTDEIRQARAGYLPTVNLNAGVGFENSRNATTVGAYRDRRSSDKDQNRTRREASIVARQVVFDGFATGSEVERQLARKLSSDYGVCSIAEDIGLQVVRVYTTVLRNEQLVANARKNIEEHQQIVSKIRSRGTAAGTRADMAQAESRLLLAKANLIAVESELFDSKAAYLSVVGKQPGKFHNPGIPGNLPKTLSKALKSALETHPVMAITQADIDAAQAQFDASKSRYMPTVTAELGATWGKDQNGGKGTTYDHTAMLRMSYNLYNGGADKARRKQTSKLVEEAMEIRNRAMRQIKEEVRLSWIAVDSGTARLKQLVAHEKNARIARKLFGDQFKGGTRTLLDLLDSQNEYFTASNSKVQADFGLLYNKYRLLHSAGALLKTLKATLPVANRCNLAVNQG